MTHAHSRTAGWRRALTLTERRAGRLGDAAAAGGAGDLGPATRRLASGARKRRSATAPGSPGAWPPTT